MLRLSFGNITGTVQTVTETPLTYTCIVNDIASHDMWVCVINRQTLPATPPNAGTQYVFTGLKYGRRMAVKRFAQPTEKDPELGSTDRILGIFDIDHYMN